MSGKSGKDRLDAIVAWALAHPERVREVNRFHGRIYRGEPGSEERAAYNAAQRERAIRREARKAAAKALALATARARGTGYGYSGTLKPNHF